MSAYNPEGIGTEAYLTRLISALCRQAGGTVRIKGELVDAVGESTVFLTEWDSAKQELVLTAPTGTHVRVFRVVPEKQTVKEVLADPLKREVAEQPTLFPTTKGSTLDDEKLTALERTLQKRRVAQMISEDLRKRRQPEA